MPQTNFHNEKNSKKYIEMGFGAVLTHVDDGILEEQVALLF